MNNRVFQLIGALILGFLIGYVIANNAGNAKIAELEDQKTSVAVENKKLTAKANDVDALNKDLDSLKAELSRLSLSSASGGGVNSKMMPHPETKELSVELQEVFSFDNNHAFCRVDNNPEAFIMPTFQMGEVLIEENEFFMAMSTTTIEEFKVTKGTDGHNEILITGGLDCFTEVAKANMTMGSREVAEFAEYRIKATDAGLGGGSAGDTFEFTVFFDPDIAPINYAIFGPEFTFTGDMIDGEITIPEPR